MRIDLVIDNLDTLDNGGPTRFSATDRSFEIGREPPRDFVLPDPERIVSSRHCEVRFEGGGFLLIDHSTNGTFVNGADSRLARPNLQPPSRPNPPVFEHEAFGFDTHEWAEAPPSAVDAVSRDGSHGAEAGPRRRGSEGLAGRENGAGDGDDGFDPPVRPDEIDDDPFEINQPAPFPEPPLRPSGGAWPRDGGDRRGLEAAPPAPPSPARQDAPPRSVSNEKAPPHRPGPPFAGAEAERLLSTIAEAAGLHPDAFAKRPPEDAARQIGALLAVVAEGVGDLLKMRAKAKTLTRSADRTTIEAVGNNPLKFSPTAEAALARMFASEGPGYLSALESFEEAFRDLSEHELITFAAMQKALKRLIDDLSPEAVMARVPTSVVPFSKKAQAWDVFVNRWDAKTEPFEHGMLDVFLQYFREIYDDSARARRR